jgi:hypothetical protein
MAATPRFKVFDSHGDYQASCHEIEAAACLVAFYGDGATIRTGHEKRKTVWIEGGDGNAGESYDAVAEHVARKGVKL